MSYSFKPAERSDARLLLALIGSSGSGKTYSALLLATGIVEVCGGRIAVIDTEGATGRALKYAGLEKPRFEFDHLKLDPPYSAERFEEAFRAAERHAQGGVVVIDSCSAEHEDEGGSLEEHRAITKGDQSKNMLAWAEIRPKQRRFLSALTRASCHVICCFRAEDKIGVGKDGKPIHLGWQAIGWKRFPYEMEVSVLLSIQHKGVPTVDGFDWGKLPVYLHGLISTERPLSIETGRRLAQWAQSGKRPAPRQSEVAPELETVRIQFGPNIYLDLPRDEAFEQLKSRLMENRGRRKALDLLTQKNFGAMAKMSGEQRGELERIYNDAVAELERQEELV